MDAVKIRFKHYRKDGTEEQVDWSFVPIKPRRGFRIHREEGDDASGKPHRAAYARRRRLSFTVPVGVLLVKAHREKFEKILVAVNGEVEIEEAATNGRKVWKKWTVDFETDIDYEYFEDLDPFEFIELEFIESEASYASSGW